MPAETYANICLPAGNHARDSLRKDSFDLADDGTIGALALLVDFVWGSIGTFDTDTSALGMCTL
ncbi:hypothetical protein AAVH_38487 [Aphelenchoides avenae]|nr:hypothetical protein AAVH_38487 [Aphelenchus avenae]